ncbi:helix-turn-helix domain-containing protein [Streptantibioticus ferralitis]|uniref:Helix-turn-helix transcriptional regulator n=1 Tax=Streptantibioticus ferralitis TaxID=236510 RepID=A0ABT5Z3J3_9ACTN|nr:helix-turn-helix transcriptional regulator [Streptantibioticus ferralitis]MDF2258397.1 helix-turn-helix transcriptional regulator [Streptantibioticus ferralitis]
MSQSEMPTMRSRRLGGELRKMREAKGLTMGDAAEALQCGQPKISRIEGGLRGIRPLDLDVLMDLYEIDRTEQADLREAMKRLAREIHQQDWWSGQGTLLHDDLKDYLTLESDSSLIRTYETQLLPGLLQTKEYMAEIFRHQRASDEAQLMLETRQQRQGILETNNGVHLRTVVDVTALNRVVGSPDLMVKQLKHLLDMTDAPNVDVQVLPLKTALPPDQYAPYTIFTMRQPPRADYVWLEHLTGSTLLEKEEDLVRYRRAWDDHTATALSAAESREHIRELIKEYQG